MDDKVETQLDDHTVDEDDTLAQASKRRRTAHACDNCRTRKTRCDGRTPCATCRGSDLECTHKTMATAKGKSDLILAAVLRMETTLERMGSQVTTYTTASSSTVKNPIQSTEQASSAQVSHSLSPVQVASGQFAGGGPETAFGTWLATVENARISRLHTSTTESVLGWPHFHRDREFYDPASDAFTSIFDLEQKRSSLPISAASMLPFTSREEVDSIVQAFQRNVNFWYPTMEKGRLDSLIDNIMRGISGDDCETCLALLTIALGCACDATESALREHDGVDASGLTENESSNSERSIHRQKMGQLYFDYAMKRLHTAYQEISSTALQCLIFTAFYYAFAQRPLQAWSYVNATATKCRVLLFYKPREISENDEECVRRIFWSCFILESDYVAELAALPLSGISDMESSVPLPGNYHTQDCLVEEEQSSLYFLACLSMRRLLNRVHHLLYNKDTGASLDDQLFPKVVAELDHQLDEWRISLPPRFQFSLDTRPAPNQQGAFLRQRYLTCRSVIYRPYLMRMLGAENPVFDEDTQEKCRQCLDACIDHILNLYGFSHTVFVDTWICSLSMAGAMVILLAAYRVPSIKPLIRPEVIVLGHHLKKLLTRWINIPSGDNSPSIQRAINWIEIADRLIKDEFTCDTYS